jgi:hypothetical protein
MNSTFFVLLTIGSALFACGVAVTLAALRRAPEGFQDGEGFHAVRGTGPQTDTREESHGTAGFGWAA